MGLDRAMPAGAAGSDTRGALIGDARDLLLMTAIVTLPVDGTRFGVTMPYWTPIAPVFFLLYAVSNPRLLLRSMRRYLGFFVFLLALVVTSAFGWTTVGFHGLYVGQTMFALVSGIACLASLDIAFRLKRLDWHKAVTLLVAVYWVAFAVGVLQWLDAQGKQQAFSALPGELDHVMEQMLGQPAGQRVSSAQLRPGEILLSAGAGGEAVHP